jgi:squalene-associated FAD-dependent desaturase
MAQRVHIIGAGLAGLSAAVELANAGKRVVLYEAGPQAGGRCRSYFDEKLGCRIDNGNHLLLSGNRSAMAYLRRIGALDSLVGPDEARFPFIDFATNERWTLSPGRGRIPFWLFDRQRRVPGTRIIDYLSGLRLARATPDATVEQVLGRNKLLYRRFWEPLAVAVLNTEASAGAAALLWPVMTESFAEGGASCRPLIAREGLTESFVDPALAWLGLRGGRLVTGMRVRSLHYTEDRVTGIELPSETLPVELGDSVVLAVPPPVALGLVPGVSAPTEYRPIVNAHYRIPGPPVESTELTGVIGGNAEWIFRRGELASVTVSAATRLVDQESDALATLLWQDVARTLGYDAGAMPPSRIVKEKRATFAQTPEQIRLRPKPTTRWRNLVLAGDWTDTGLPATIEGAIRSGTTAASCLLAAT